MEDLTPITPENFSSTCKDLEEMLIYSLPDRKFTQTPLNLVTGPFLSSICRLPAHLSPNAKEGELAVISTWPILRVEKYKSWAKFPSTMENLRETKERLEMCAYTGIMDESVILYALTPLLDRVIHAERNYRQEGMINMKGEIFKHLKSISQTSPALTTSSRQMDRLVFLARPTSYSEMITMMIRVDQIVNEDTQYPLVPVLPSFSVEESHLLEQIRPLIPTLFLPHINMSSIDSCPLFFKSLPPSRLGIGINAENRMALDYLIKQKIPLVSEIKRLATITPWDDEWQRVLNKFMGSTIDLLKLDFTHTVIYGSALTFLLCARNCCSTTCKEQEDRTYVHVPSFCLRPADVFNASLVKGVTKRNVVKRMLRAEMVACHFLDIYVTDEKNFDSIAQSHINCITSSKMQGVNQEQDQIDPPWKIKKQGEVYYILDQTRLSRSVRIQKGQIIDVLAQNIPHAWIDKNGIWKCPSVLIHLNRSSDREPYFYSPYGNQQKYGQLAGTKICFGDFPDVPSNGSLKRLCNPLSLLSQLDPQPREGYHNIIQRYARQYRQMRKKKVGQVSEEKERGQEHVMSHDMSEIYEHDLSQVDKELLGRLQKQEQTDEFGSKWPEELEDDDTFE